MKEILQTLIVGFAFIGLILCLSIQFKDVPVEVACPQYNAIFGVMTPFGPMVIHMTKGNFNEENHSLEAFHNLTGWITLEEYKAYIIAKGSI